MLLSGESNTPKSGFNHLDQQDTCGQILLWQIGANDPSSLTVRLCDLDGNVLQLREFQGATQAVQQQLGTAEAGQLVEDALSRIARGLVSRGVGQLVVAGGETSGACVQALGIQTLRIGAAIAPGVPWCHARGEAGALHITLKSGNFGTDDFFTKAFTVLA